MNKYIMEFIGTFFLVLAIGLAVPNAGNMAPIAIGAVLIGMIYAGGHISMAHYNPAVTIAFWLRKRFPVSEIAPYVGAQVVAAVLAALTAQFLGGGGSNPEQVEIVPALLAEFLFTFALAFVILNVATSKNTTGNDSYGVAIGMVVIGGAYTVGSISGAVFNPAVAIGASLMGLLNWADIWLYMVANFAGGALAGVTFLFLNPDDH
ncbi:aquaporin [Anaerolineales bacterium HSG6]|nr:aquaporin [Anaerolineales bacterium HSG6]